MIEQIVFVQFLFREARPLSQLEKGREIQRKFFNDE